MYELALFPLFTVLFPGMPLHLHIFEPRYRLMIQRCLEANQPFGVVLIRKGEEAMGPLAEPYITGCTARIARTERLRDGSMNLTVLGEERFPHSRTGFQTALPAGQSRNLDAGASPHAAPAA